MSKPIRVIGAMAQAGIIVKGDGKPVVQDGPFADTKEQLGGHFVIEVPGFRIEVDLPAQLTRCTCSFCAKRGPRLDKRNVEFGLWAS